MNEVFWVRLFCAEFDDPRWLAIEQMPDADAVQIIYVRMLMLAGRSNAEGLLLLHESLPYDVTTLAAVLRRSVPVVQFALATLEKFRFIEMVDNVIAITEWDRLQATDELAKLADRREKDKVRKRESRAEKKNILLPSKDMSADASVDSPRKSRTTKIESNSDKATTSTTPFEVVVDGAIAEEIDEILALIPSKEINRRLRLVISDAVKKHGMDITLSNVRYALKHHDRSKGKLGGMICSAIKDDFACAERAEERVEDEARLAARVRQETAEAAKREREERERKEALAHQAAWLALPPEDQAELARQAFDKFPCLPDSTQPLETVLDNTAVPITKILAAMFANGDLSLPSGGR